MVMTTVLKSQTHPDLVQAALRLPVVTAALAPLLSLQMRAKVQAAAANHPHPPDLVQTQTQSQKKSQKKSQTQSQTKSQAKARMKAQASSNSTPTRQ